MTFALVGRHGNDALDEQTGVMIISRGARGPEIENHFWDACVDGLTFEFSTRIADKGDDFEGKRKVYLTPSADLIAYLKDDSTGDHRHEALVASMVEGIIFLTPFVHFKGSFSYIRTDAIVGTRVDGRASFRRVNAPGLWDPGSVVR